MIDIGDMHGGMKSLGVTSTTAEVVLTQCCSVEVLRSVVPSAWYSIA